MKTYLQQGTALRQDLRMNPRLYQAMDLLYMPLLDLQQHLKEELLTNPFLEFAEAEEETPAETKATEQEKKEQQETAEKGDTDWEGILLDGFQVGASRGDYSDGEFVERVPVDTRDLTDHLRDQLQLLDLTSRQMLLADEFVGNISEDGYLQAPLDEVLRGVNDLVRRFAGSNVAEPPPPDEEVALSVEPVDQAVALEQVEDLPDADLPLYTEADAEEVLGIMQRLDPPGIAARDLRECLLLQLDEFELQETLTYRLVRDEYDDLITHRWSELVKRYGLDPKEVQDAADVLAKLDPKPGLRYSSASDAYVVPDLTVQKIDGKYRVFLNDAGMPRLRISKVYQELAGDKKKFVGESKEFVTEKLNGATWLIRAIEQRRQTMLKVMNFIVDKQRQYFEKGVEHLQPLTLREVADVIDMHESTVSRVTSQKYVQTPRGVLPLKFFFSSSLGTTTGEDASARAVKAQIQKLVADEDQSKPLTDSEIVSALKGRGVRIARRTVAKYRDQLGILPARMRKRV